MRFPRPRSRASTHFLWLLSAAAFLFAGVIWSGSKAHAVELTPVEAKSQEAERAKADRVALLGRLQLAGIASRRAGPPRSRVTKPKLPPPPTPSEQNRALVRYMAWVGVDSVQAMVSQSGSQLSQQVLADDRITLASGYGDVASRQDRSAGAGAPALPRRVIRPGHRLVPHHGPLEVRRALEEARSPRTTTAAPSTSARSAACP